ncbi:hypothetical protein EVAR_59249_1 [Eumeta japonica]|uniref:Uncharacterized protein n=1 Tax=Eumeta variegata TaxID=151549 RepID=A0A4C2A520_EUMVA|nr:hypothetical protein EVAR_59249_1 [Eumeta japonica]
MWQIGSRHRRSPLRQSRDFFVRQPEIAASALAAGGRCLPSDAPKRSRNRKKYIPPVLSAHRLKSGKLNAHKSATSGMRDL